MENSRIKSLKLSLTSLQNEIKAHSLFSQIDDEDSLEIFMENHIFAVWDFMSLLKKIQQELTCVTLPWRPVGEPRLSRLINEIVLGEESDQLEDGSICSHFEMYLAAMRQCGADPSRVEDFLTRLEKGAPLELALKQSEVPKPAQSFVRQTWSLIENTSLHERAAAFALGREDLIPDMFRNLIADLQQKFPDKFSIFYEYLNRHIHLDEETHTPLALEMVATLCGKDEQKWKEAEASARRALEARGEFWNGILGLIS